MLKKNTGFMKSLEKSKKILRKYKIITSFFVVCLFFILLFYVFNPSPRKLKRISLADSTGIVTDIKNIKVEGVENVINTSLVDYKDGYLIVFRKNENKKSYIALCELDKNFKQTSPYKIIDVKSSFAEDPRIFQFSNDYFLIYNDKVPIKHNYRIMKIAKLTNDFNVEFINELDLHIKQIEKNWVPFTNENNLYLSYGLMPHKVMNLKDVTKNSLDHLIFDNGSCYARFFWEFGEPRGGTPAKLVDGEYLAFFHSCFGKNKKKKHYVMGAYTFQAHPPYKITKVSKDPILVSNKKTRVYFPCGFTLKNEHSKDKIILSYGENDENSKVLIIDKEKLFQSLKEVY
ncbi:MAG: hypothetical protein JXA94_00480 [Parachlamydiales bacterium]|nr:hypothetical protein [Parachlamydiales bacterium]